MTSNENEAICEKLMKLPPSTFDNDHPREKLLRETFMGNTNNFCRFIGFMMSRLSIIKHRRDEAVSIMSDVAMAAVSVGREEGEVYSLQQYGAPEFRFLLNNRRKAG